MIMILSLLLLIIPILTFISFILFSCVLFFKKDISVQNYGTLLDENSVDKAIDYVLNLISKS